jgi:uncharacterized protein (DUF1800 family)
MSTPDAAIAAHRFGLGEPTLDGPARDPRGWLVQQIGAADAQVAQGNDPLPSASVGMRRFAEFIVQQRRRRADETMSAEVSFGEHFRTLVQADVRARMVTAATTSRPFAERLAMFWANHFTVSMAKASARGLVGAFEREAIRPHIGGRFEDLLRAAVMHPGMLRYLDNEQSAGPHSRVARRRANAPREMGDVPRLHGLNENLAREVLELHTLGAASARAGTYTQADVTAFAAVLTGWRVPVYAYMPEAVPARRGNNNDLAPLGDPSPTRFDPAWHEPGPKTVLGQRIPEGAEGLSSVLGHLARHQATAEFIATKLSRHFVADDPPRALVDRLATAFKRSDGDLPAVYRALVDAPEAWREQPVKLKSPEELVVSTARVLRLGTRGFERQPDAGLGILGQRLQAAPSPAGWPDAAEEWLGPDAVWKRVEWVTRLAERVGSAVDARTLAQASLGPLLTRGTLQQIERAADGPQALALLLLAPEFQRR